MERLLASLVIITALFGLELAIVRSSPPAPRPAVAASSNGVAPLAPGGPGSSPPPASAPLPAERPPYPPTPPVENPPASARPFRLTRVAEFWAFSPDHTAYSMRARMLFTKTRPPFAFVPLSIPIDEAHPPRDVKVTSSVRVLKMEPGRNPQGYATFRPVLLPLEEPREGASFEYGVSYREDVVPYLHGSGMSHRMLSLTFGEEDDLPERFYGFAVPESSRTDSVTDFQPARVRTVSGWRIYEYDATRKGQVTMHILFDFGTPTTPAPTVEALLESSSSPR